MTTNDKQSVEQFSYSLQHIRHQALAVHFITSAVLMGPVIYLTVGSHMGVWLLATLPAAVISSVASVRAGNWYFYRELRKLEKELATEEGS